MRVKDLIEHLQKLPPETEVFALQSFTQGYDTLTRFVDLYDSNMDFIEPTAISNKPQLFIGDDL